MTFKALQTGSVRRYALSLNTFDLAVYTARSIYYREYTINRAEKKDQ